MIKIKKPLARKMYYSGHTITVVPCKCNVTNKVAKAKLSMMCGGEIDTITLSNSFDISVREFEYYNCNSETGYYAHYYVSEEDYNKYQMCKMMCN